MKSRAFCEGVGGGLFLLAALTLFPFSEAAEMPAHIKIGTAAIGGSFYPLGGGIAKAINQNLKGVNATAEVTAGSGENIRLLDKNRLHFGIISNAIGYVAMNGLEKWDKKYNLSACFMISPTIDVFITLRKSGIKSIPDMRGKKVAVGPAGGAWDDIVKPFFEAYNMSYKDFTPRYLGQSAAVEALKDGAIDVAFVGGSLPSAAIMEATLSHDIFFIPIGDEIIAKLCQKYPYFAPFTIPANTYKGLTSDFKWIDVGTSYLVCRPDADAEMVYRVVKTVYNNRQMVAEIHPAGKDMLPKDAMPTMKAIPFHPAAIKFYKEVGVWKEK